MAKSGKGAGSPLLPIAIIAVVVVAVMAAVFGVTGTEPPDQATIIAEDDVAAEPAGAGTTPEGEADEAEEGITDQVDEVTPAAPGEDQVPAADEVEAQTPDQGTEGETDADEQVTGTVNSPVAGEGSDEAATMSGDGDGAAAGRQELEAGETGAGGADGELGDEGSPAPQEGQPDAGAQDEFLMDEDSDNPGAGTPSTTEPSGGDAAMPEGRDAETELDPEEGQEVIRDDDNGGAGFVPTPSGPEGRDGNPLTGE